jgi:hypothetical protein
LLRHQHILFARIFAVACAPARSPGYKVGDIDIAQDFFCVVKSNGRKHRNVMLSLLAALV